MPIAAVCWASVAVGGFLGLQCGWQTAVESAQVLAGVVSYPAENPFFQYHVRTWTLLHQLPALGVVCGLREAVLSAVLGATAGALTFMAVSLTLLALTRQRLLAVAAPLLMFAASTYLETRGVYPLRMLAQKTWAIYGVVGSGWALLAWALLALRRYRLAGLVMGLAPAVHPLLGAWCVAIGLGATCVGRWRLPGGRRLRWFAIGAAGSAASLMVQLMWTSGLADVAAGETAALVNAYAAHWDTHRQPYPLHDASIVVSLMTVLLLAAIWRRSPHGGSAATISAILGLSTVVSLLLCVATHFGAYLPSIVQSCMPGRFINLTVLMFPVVVWAAAWHLCPRRMVAAIQVTLCLACLAKLVPSGTDPVLEHTWPLMMAAGGYCLLWPWMRRTRSTQATPHSSHTSDDTPAGMDRSGRQYDDVLTPSDSSSKQDEASRARAADSLR